MYFLLECAHIMGIPSQIYFNKLYAGVLILSNKIIVLIDFFWGKAKAEEMY